MDFKLQLQNIADLSRRLADFCDDSLIELEGNEIEELSEEKQKRNMEYILSTIREQVGLINNVFNVGKISLETLLKYK